MSDPLGVRKKLVKYQGRAITDEEWLKFVQMTEESINKDPSWICVCLCLDIAWFTNDILFDLSAATDGEERAPIIALIGTMVLTVIDALIS